MTDAPTPLPDTPPRAQVRGIPAASDLPRWVPRTGRAVTWALAAGLVVTAAPAARADTELINTFVDQFTASATLILNTLHDEGLFLFGVLAVLELVVSSFLSLMRGSDLGAFLARLLIKVILLAVLFTLMETAFTWLSLFADSFSELGRTTVTTPDPISGPSELLDLGRALAADVLANLLPSFGIADLLSASNMIRFLVMAGAALGVYLTCAFAAVSLGLVLIELAVLLPMSPLLLAFSAFKETSPLASAALAYLLGLGIRVMLTWLIIMIAVLALKAVLATLVPDVTDLFFGLDLFVPTYLFFKAVKAIPAQAASALTGHVTLDLAALHELGRT